MMKSLLILFLGCLPLSVLTVWSFVELATLDVQLAPPEIPGNVEGDGAAARQVAEVEREKPLVRQLAAIDLFSREAIAVLEDLPEPSSFSPLKEPWPNWTAACRMVGDFAEIECLMTATALEQTERSRLEELKGQFEALKKSYEGATARRNRQFLALVDARIGILQQEIKGRDRQREADDLWRFAQAAFESGEYAPCMGHCRRLLSEHSPVMDPARINEVERLRTRAEFRDDAGQCSSRFGSAKTSSEQAAVLEDFLKRYTGTDRSLLAGSELAILDRCQRRLLELERQLALDRTIQEARQAIDQLDQNLPPAFNDRLKAAAQIVNAYPADAVKSMLRGRVQQWLEEFLPAKQIRERPGLEEVETTEHLILRGFFKEVLAVDGTLIGYQRYPTPEARDDSDFQVGTYRKEEFSSAPGPSAPQQCVSRYHEARSRLLAAPGRREAWSEMASLCESLERMLGEYRAKRGASQENADLSFDREGRFAREISAGAGWTDLQSFFGP